MKHFLQKINVKILKILYIINIRMDPVNELQKYILIKRDVRDLRQIIFGQDEHIHDWDRILIVYSLFLMYQHVFLIYDVMKKINQHSDFNFQRDYKNLYIFVFFLCNLRTSYLYMIKSVIKVDKPLAGSLHANMGEYFEY